MFDYNCYNTSENQYSLRLATEVINLFGNRRFAATESFAIGVTHHAVCLGRTLFFSRVQLLCSMVVERREAKQGQRQRQKQRHACLFFWNRAGNLQLGLAASSVLHRSNRCCGHPSEVVDWTGDGRNRGKRGPSHLSRMQLHMYVCCVCVHVQCPHLLTEDYG